MAKPLKLTKQERDNTKYQITMQGLYFSRSTDGITEEPYEVKFIMTHKQTETLIPQAFFKHDREIKTMMKHKYPQFLGTYSTFHVVEAKCDKPELLANNIWLLNRLELEEYIADNELPINIVLHDDDMSLRQAIIDYRKDKEGFVKQQELLEKRKKPLLDHRKALGTVATAKELLALNELKPRKNRVHAEEPDIVVQGKEDSDEVDDQDIDI